jgi:hypothetical protein
MRFASLDKDYWELRSAEDESHKHPDTFHIPPQPARCSLQHGDAAKLIFDIEGEDEDGTVIIQGERMWVIVSEVGEGYYIGILDDEPALIETGDDVYLCFGAEVPFRAEHIIDIERPPSEYIEWQLGQHPKRVWSR